jgi:hypothetical protein
MSMAETDSLDSPTRSRPRNPIFPAFPIAVISIATLVGLYAAVAHPFGFRYTAVAAHRFGSVIPLATPGAVLPEVRTRVARPRLRIRSALRPYPPVDRRAASTRPRYTARDCEIKGISTSEAREGSCMGADSAGSHPVEYRVVDRARTLHMPNYTVRIVGWHSRPFPITRRRADTEAAEPKAVISALLVVTNTSRDRLVVPGMVGGRHRFADEVIAELFAPDLEGPYPVAADRAAPGPSGGPVPKLRTIAPRATVRAWINFVAHASTVKQLTAREANVDFYNTEHGREITGRIRLWK